MEPENIQPELYLLYNRGNNLYFLSWHIAGICFSGHPDKDIARKMTLPEAGELLRLMPNPELFEIRLYSNTPVACES